MNVLDENVIEDQRQLLHRWGIRTQQIGQDIGQKGMQDQEQIVPLLHQLSRVTFFTGDLGFYNPQLCHGRHCMVCLAVSQYEMARYVRRFLRHGDCNTWAKRKGAVVRLTHVGIRRWRLNSGEEEFLPW